LPSAAEASAGVASKAKMIADRGAELFIIAALSPQKVM
jgi:hypothetical protein